jgi:hypothetical protein
MPTYTVHAAKTNLSKLLERAEKGEEVIIPAGRNRWPAWFPWDCRSMYCAAAPSAS